MCRLAVYVSPWKLLSPSARLTHGLFGLFRLLETVHVTSVKLSGVWHVESEKRDQRIKRIRENRIESAKKKSTRSFESNTIDKHIFLKVSFHPAQPLHLTDDFWNS